MPGPPGAAGCTAAGSPAPRSPARTLGEVAEPIVGVAGQVERVPDPVPAVRRLRQPDPGEAVARAPVMHGRIERFGELAAAAAVGLRSPGCGRWCVVPGRASGGRRARMSDVEILGVEPDDDDPYRFVWAMDPRTRETLLAVRTADPRDPQHDGRHRRRFRGRVIRRSGPLCLPTRDPSTPAGRLVRSAHRSRS
jgi:hypothetical protein